MAAQGGSRHGHRAGGRGQPQRPQPRQRGAGGRLVGADGLQRRLVVRVAAVAPVPPRGRRAGPVERRPAGAPRPRRRCPPSELPERLSIVLGVVDRRPLVFLRT